MDLDEVMGPPPCRKIINVYGEHVTIWVSKDGKLCRGTAENYLQWWTKELWGSTSATILGVLGGNRSPQGALNGGYSIRATNPRGPSIDSYYERMRDAENNAHPRRVVFIPENKLTDDERAEIEDRFKKAVKNNSVSILPWRRDKEKGDPPRDISFDAKKWRFKK